jgi:hypothetical protein
MRLTIIPIQTKIFCVICALATLLMAACSAEEHIARADREVTAFHKKFNAGDFAMIYDSSSDEFKQSARKEDMVKFFESVRSKLGDITSTKKLDWHLNYQPSDTIVTLNYETQFSKGIATEVFMYRVKDQNVILAGYRIDSRDLVTQ